MSAGEVATPYEHVVLDEDGVPVVSGSNTKVVEIALDMLAHGSSPAELHFQLPHLSLGQIHSALAYYWDHKEELDADIEERLRNVRRWRADTPVPALVERLRQRGLV